MFLSATDLGKSYGLTAQEMNRLLLRQGFLEGEPGDYAPTAKAIPYVLTKDFHYGPGGYSFYNKYWTSVKFDESIKEILDTSMEAIRQAREEVEAMHLAQKIARAEARAQADAAFIAKQAAEKAAKEAEILAELEAAERVRKLKEVGKIGLVIIGSAAVVVGICIIVPKVKQWWNERKQSIEISDDAQQERSTQCPNLNPKQENPTKSYIITVKKP